MKPQLHSESLPFFQSCVNGFSIPLSMMWIRYVLQAEAEGLVFSLASPDIMTDESVH